MNDNKFLVIAILEHFSTDSWVVHYYKVDDTIKDILVKFLVRDMSVTMDTLKKFHVNKVTAEIAKNSISIAPDILEDEISYRYNYTMNKIDDYCKNWIHKESCGDGELNFEVKYMTDEEFNNPTGIIASPYDEYDRDKVSYPFYHPITKKLVRPSELHTLLLSKNELETLISWFGFCETEGFAGDSDKDLLEKIEIMIKK